MRIVEVILASFVIVFAVSAANLSGLSPTNPQYEVTELEKLGYNVLNDLDQQGLLAKFVYNSEWNNLTAALRVSLPFDVYYNVTIFDLDGNIINNDPVFYGNPDTFANPKEAASVTYGMVGYPARIVANSTISYQTVYAPRILSLTLTRG